MFGISKKPDTRNKYENREEELIKLSEEIDKEIETFLEEFETRINEETTLKLVKNISWLHGAVHDMSRDFENYIAQGKLLREDVDTNFISQIYNQLETLIEETSKNITEFNTMLKEYESVRRTFEADVIKYERNNLPESIYEKSIENSEEKFNEALGVIKKVDRETYNNFADLMAEKDKVNSYKEKFEFPINHHRDDKSDLVNEYNKKILNTMR